MNEKKVKTYGDFCSFFFHLLQESHINDVQKAESREKRNRLFIKASWFKKIQQKSQGYKGDIKRIPT